jgi:hypothetical protein
MNASDQQAKERRDRVIKKFMSNSLFPNHENHLQQNIRTPANDPLLIGSIPSTTHTTSDISWRKYS